MDAMRYLILAAFTAGVIADPAYNRPSGSLQQCAISCPQAAGKFSYMPGQTYEYRYNADIQTNIPGSRDQSNLHLSASVFLDVVSPCELSLRVTSVMLQDSDPSNADIRQHVDKHQQFKQAIESKPLRFAFIDGKIENICPSTDEQVWVLNIKRGILSTLQNTMNSLQGVSESLEADITGSCPVKYSVEENQSTLKLKKNKNLIRCKDRTSTQSIFQGVGYETESEIQSAPLLKGTLQCEQEIDAQSKIYKKIECVEKHVFRPFQKESSGATTQIKYRLVFQRNTADPQNHYGSLGPSRLSLLYDHSLSAPEMESNVRQAQQSISTLCRQTQPDVRPEAPGTFSQLVQQMRGLDMRSLRQLQSSSQSACPKAVQFFRDAIAHVGSPASISIIADLITSNQVSSREADLLLTSISFIQSPTRELLRELQTLLQSQVARASLPVSSVVYAFSKLNPGESPEVAAILKIFEDQLKYNCRANGAEDKVKMLLALRAIGNAGGAARLAPILDRCALNDQAPMVVRVAATQAYRRIPCSVSRDQMYVIYSNKEQDSELRINAYLALIQCADVTVISRIHGLLNEEVVNQVGSFVWTHLTNLAETSNPLKTGISEIISDPKLLKEFDVDKRKYSRNLEFSTFSNYLNMGGSAESNLIMSSQSYIPRSASFNFTAELFGRSFNFLDIGVRAQGFEEVLEKHFGPGSDIEETMKRDRRAVVNDQVIQTIDRQYSVSRDPMELSYYMRIFGNEIKSGDITDFNMDSVKDRLDTRDILAKLAQQRSIDITRSYAFLDTSLTVPTGIGMPVKLSVEGTITAGLTASGKVDVRRMLANPSDFDVTGSIRPSTAIEIQGDFGLDAHVTQTKLRLVNRMHSSLLIDASATLRNGQVFKFDWNMPQEKIEIFSAESRFYIAHRGQDREQTSPTQKDHKRCTSPQLSEKVGLELCGEISYPSQGSVMINPLAGPSAVKIYLNKKDTFTKASLEASIIRNQGNGVDTARFSFNTPGSRVDRELIADFKLDRNNKDFSLTLKSPWKRAVITGLLQSEPALKKAVLKAIVDESTEYSVNAEVRAEHRNNAVKYVPNIKVVWPGRQPITMEGALNYIKGRRVQGNMVVKNALREPITIDGSIQMVNRTKQTKYDVNVQFSSPILRGSVIGYATNIADRTQTWSSRLDVNYQYQNGPKQRIVLNNKIRDTSSPNLNSYSADGSWSTTMWPRYNGRFEYKKAYSANSMRTTFDAGFDAVRKITIVQSGAYDFNGVDKKLNAEVKIELPYYRVNYETKINHIHNWDLLQSNATIKYDENREHSLDIGFKKDTQRYLNAVAEAKLKLAGREPMMFTNTLIERAPRQYHNRLSIDAAGRSLSAMGLYKMAQRHELNADIQATGYEPISISGHLNPNLKNVQAKIDLKYGRRNYMTDINWLYREGPGAFNARAGVEIGYLGKKYGLSGDMSKVNHNISANIQVLCGLDRRVSVSTKISADRYKPEFQTRIQWPQNFVDVLATGKYSSQQSRSSEHEGILKITTGFQNYEELGGNLKVESSPETMKSSGQVIWGRQKKISGDLTYGRGRVDLNLVTPFQGYRTVKANAAYNKRGSTYDITGGAEWESNRLSATGRMTHERGNGLSTTNQGELTLRGPWDGMREAKLTWRHQNDDGTFWKCHHEVEVDRRQKYIVDLDASSNRVAGRNHELKIKGTFTSPIPDWEHVAVAWESTRDYQTIRASGTGSVTWGRNTINLDHELNVQPNTFIAKALVRTPYRGYEVMGVDMNNRLDSRTRSYTLKNELSLGEPSKKVGLEGNLMYNGPTFNTGLRLTTPHQDYPRIAANLRNGRQQDGAWALHGDLEVRRGTSFTLDGKLGWSGKYGAELSLSSPFQSLRAMTVKAMGSAVSAKQFEGDLEVSHNLMQNKAKLAADVNIQTMENAKVSLTLETPWNKLRVAKFGASHIYQSTERCLSTITYEFNQVKGQLTHEQNVRSASEFDGKTRLEYRQGQEITLNHRVAMAEFSRNGRGTITASLATPFNEARSVDATMNLSGRSDNFRSTLELVINRRDRINGNLEFSSIPQRGILKATTGLTTPYQSLRNFQASYDQSGSPFDHRGPDWDSDIEVSYQVNDKRWWSKRTFNLDREGAMKFNVKTQIPDSPNPSEFNLEHTPKNGRNGETGWSNKGFLQVEGVRYSGESEYIWRNGQQLTAKVVLNTPQEEYNVMLNHRDNRGQVTTELSGKAGPHGTGSLSFTMNPGASSIQLTTNVQTPYRTYEKFDLSLRHEGPSNNFRTTGSLTTSIPEYRSFKAEMTHTGAPENFNCVVKMETPFTAIPSLTVRLNHKMTQSGLEASVNVEYAGKSVSSSLNFVNDGRTITITSNLQTPYQGYESFTFNLEHSATSWKSFRSSARLTTPFTKLPQLGLGLELSAERLEEVRAKAQIRLAAGESSATYSHTKNPSGDLTVNLEVVTPYRYYERSSLAVEHLNRNQQTKVTVNAPYYVFTGEKTGNLRDLTLKGDIKLQSDTSYTINWRHTATNGGIDLTTVITTPIRGFDRVNLAIKHQPTGANGFKSTGKLETTAREYNKFGYEVEHRDDGRGFRTNLKVETPVRGYDKFETTVEYSSPRQSAEEFRASVQLITPVEGYRNFGVSINHAGPASRFQTTARVTTPFSQAPQIDLTLKHQGATWREFKTSLEAQYGAKKIDLETIFKYQDHDGYESDNAASIKFNSPCPHFNNFEINASHNRKSQLKSGALMVKLNNDKKIDFDYSYNTEGARNIIINLRDPYQMGTTVNVGDTTGSAIVDYDRSDASKKIKFDFGFKDIKSETASERLLSFKTSIPNSRTVGFLLGYKCSQGRFSNRGELYWDRDYSPDFVYELEGGKSESYNLKSYDGKLKVTSDLVNFDTQFNHKTQPGRKHETELSAGGQSGRLIVKSDVTVRSDTDYVHTITIQHPRLTQDASIVTEVTGGNKFKSTFSFDRQTATLEGSYTNESRGPFQSRYSSMVRLEHPNSMTDIKLTGLVFSDQGKLGGSIESEYKTAKDRQIKTSTLKAEIDRLKGELAVELLTPLEDFKLKTKNRGADTYEQELYRYDVIASIGRHDYKYSVDLSTRDRSADVKLYDNNDFIQIFAQFYSPLQSQIDVSRTLQGRKHNDAQLAISIQDDRLVKGRAYMRPQISQDVKKYVQDLDRYPPAIIRNLVQSSERLKRAIAEEWQMKKSLLEESLSSFRPLVEAISAEAKQAFENIQSAYNAAYYRNDFYIKDIHQALQRHYEDLSRQVQLKSREVQRQWQDMSIRARQANKVVIDKWNEISETLAQKRDEMRRSLEESLQSTGRYFDDVSGDMRRKVLQHIHKMENHPFYRDYALMKPSDFLLPPEQWADKLKSNFNRVMAKIESDIDQLVAANRPQIEQIKQKVFKYLQQNQEIFMRLGMENQLREYMYKMQVMTWPQLKQQIKQSLSDFFQWQRTKWTVWDPQRGEYAFEAYVPFNVPDLSTVQKVYSMDALSGTKSFLPKIYIPEDWTLMDLVYAYRPVTDVSDWVPPFKAHATVVGNQHYMTFDRKFYEFAGECSYLLARDFIGKTFSVVVNYERTSGAPVKKSISVLTAGKQLEISTEGKLTVDGRRSEMPVKVGNTTVSRQGNSIVVNNELGLEVNCDLIHNHCTVAVSGWYYGKTAGLFGTYDNEAFNDFMSTDKSLKESAGEMASEWSVGARCRPTNHATIITPDKSSRRYQACAELFEDDSSVMRSCFRKISPKPYMDMCLNDAPSGSNSLQAEHDVCKTAAAYWHECRSVEVHIRMPASCVQCEVPLSRFEKFYEGETKTLKEGSVPKSADVVFVIQHAPCNNAVVSKIRESVDDMNKAFTASGLREVRFAVVGFGGSDHLASAHVHTMDGQIFAEASLLSSAMHAFSTESVPSSEQPDAMAALAYAARLPFRAGVSKSLILVACDSCQEVSVRYSDIQRVLINSDVRLHVLSAQRIGLKSRSPKTSLIFGVDDETVYTSKDVSDDELSGESDLRKYVRLPKDLCVALTHSTDGSVFSSPQWTQSAGNLQKKFTDVFSRALAMKAQPTDCQQCECVADNVGAGVPHCSSCYRKNPIFSLLPNFSDDDYSDEIKNEIRSRVRNDEDSDNEDDDDERSNQRNNSPGAQRRPKPKQDRVPRPPRPQRPQAVRPQRIPGRPEVRDQ